MKWIYFCIFLFYPAIMEKSGTPNCSYINYATFMYCVWPSFSWNLMKKLSACISCTIEWGRIAVVNCSFIPEDCIVLELFAELFINSFLGGYIWYFKFISYIFGKIQSMCHIFVCEQFIRSSIYPFISVFCMSVDMSLSIPIHIFVWL